MYNTTVATPNNIIAIQLLTSMQMDIKQTHHIKTEKKPPMKFQASVFKIFITEFLALSDGLLLLISYNAWFIYTFQSYHLQWTSSLIKINSKSCFTVSERVYPLPTHLLALVSFPVATSTRNEKIDPRSSPAQRILPLASKARQ